MARTMRRKSRTMCDVASKYLRYTLCHTRGFRSGLAQASRRSPFAVAPYRPGREEGGVLPGSDGWFREETLLDVGHDSSPHRWSRGTVPQGAQIDSRY